MRSDKGAYDKQKENVTESKAIFTINMFFKVGLKKCEGTTPSQFVPRPLDPKAAAVLIWGPNINGL